MTPLDRCLEAWHDVLRSGDASRLDALVHDDCVFSSPIVFTPQRGKEITVLYLTAAIGQLAGSGGVTDGAAPRSPSGDDWDGRFRYVREVRDGNHAVLEFETTIDGKYVNGVDLIECDDDGRIVDFKVMVRPMQAVTAVHEQMQAAIAALNG